MNPFVQLSPRQFLAEGLVVIALVFAINAAAAPTVVLPERFANSPVIVENSPQFKSLVAQNKQLVKQLETEKRAKQDFQTSVDNALRAKAAELQTLREENAKMKAAQASSHWGVFSTLFGAFRLGVSFFSNPLAFITGFVIKLLLGVAIGGALIMAAVKIAIHYFRKHKPTQNAHL